MNNPSRFTRASRSYAVPFTKFCRSKFTVLHAAGIVNPFGPTLSMLAIDRELENPSCQSILRVSVNPYSQTCENVGRAEIGDTWNPLADISPFLLGLLASCPTLLLSSTLLKEDVALAICANHLMQFEDGGGVLERVKQFPKDPWKRVKSEVDSVAKRSRNARHAPAEGTRLDEPASRELAALLLEPEAAKTELQAFIFAWNGAIKFQRGGILSKGAMPFEDLARILGAMSLSCRIPDLGN